MRIRYTPRAFSDLENIRSYISQYNPSAAGRVIGLIEKVVARLSEFPESGQRADELDTLIAFSIRYPYRIYYRVASGHAARQPLQPGEI